jgi:hypothetical protein
VVVWVWELLTAEAYQGHPQTTEQRIEKRWKSSGQSVEATSKEGQQKDEER